MSKRLDQEREKRLQPKRKDYAKKQIMLLGHEIEDETSTSFIFRYMGSYITVYPYSGWYTGKSIVDGRGIENLLKQLNNE